MARPLVVFLKRPGGQAQFSSHLSAQLADRDVVAEVQTWVADHLDDDLSVAAPRRRAAMSPRHFARVFRAETGVTPARYVERARVERARSRLEETGAGVEEIARGCGFGTAETMRRAFLRSLWVGTLRVPAAFRAAAPRTAEVTDMSVTTGILLFDDVEELDFAGPFEVFGMAAMDGDRVVTIAERLDPSAAPRACGCSPTSRSPTRRRSTCSSCPAARARAARSTTRR